VIGIAAGQVSLLFSGMEAQSMSLDLATVLMATMRMIAAPPVKRPL
jgi:hypothetical protein